jgi:hypothetical protein
VEQSDVEKQIGELEIAVDRLRSLYEQYFVGIEKIEPQVPRKDVDRRIYALRKEQIRNTALRFRFQMVLQRYNTYQTHWQRICREIENGTYKRHMIRAQRRFGSTRPPRGRSSVPPPALAPRPEPGAPLAPDLAAQLAELDRDFAVPATPIDAARASFKVLPPRPSLGPLAGMPKSPAAGASALPSVAPRPGIAPPLPPMWKKVAPLAGAPPAGPAPAVAPAVAPPPAPAKQAPPTAPAPLPLSLAKPAQQASTELPEQRLRQLYSELVETKRRQNESTAAITYQSVAKSLLESSDRLRKKHGREVDFEVMVKDGKAVLRPVLK